MYGLVCAHIGHARHASDSQAHLKTGKLLGKLDPQAMLTLLLPTPMPVPPEKPVQFFSLV